MKFLCYNIPKAAKGHKKRQGIVPEKSIAQCKERNAAV